MKKKLTRGGLSLIGFCCFSAWNLSFLFEGQILYALAAKAAADGAALAAAAVFTAFVGLFSAGFLLKNLTAAQRVIFMATCVSLAGSLLFYLPFTRLWQPAIVVLAYCSGLVVAGWGYCFKNYFAPEQRFRTAADVLIFSNI